MSKKRKGFLELVREREQQGEIPEYEKELKEAGEKLSKNTEISTEQQDESPNQPLENGRPDQQSDLAGDYGRLSQQTNMADQNDCQTWQPQTTDKHTSQNSQTYITDSQTNMSDCQSKIADHYNRPDQQTDLPDNNGRPKPSFDDYKNYLSTSKNNIKTEKQRKVYNYLAQNPYILISYSILCNKLGIPYNTMRSILNKFNNLGLISKETYRGKNGQQGLVLTLNQNLLTDHYGRPDQQTLSTEKNVRPFDESCCSKIDRSIYLSSLGESEGVEGNSEKLLSLTEDDITFYWPNLFQKGFGPYQIRQIVDRLKKVAKPTDKIIRSLDYAEFELENGLMQDKDGNSINDPVSYVFNSLAKTGYYRRPKGYISPEEQAEEDAKLEAERIRKAKQERENAEFLAWKESLSEQEYQEIIKDKKGPEDAWVKHYWRKNIKEN